MLSEADHKRIADAITRAESKTSGEIFCVLAQGVTLSRSAAGLGLGSAAVAGAGGAGRVRSFSASGRYQHARTAYHLFPVAGGAVLAVALIVAQPRCGG